MATLVIITIASLLVVLCIHLNTASAYGWTGMYALRYILSDSYLTKMMAIAFVAYFAISFGILYLIYWLLS